MREILFRGKTENGEWVQGYYLGVIQFPNSIYQNCIVEAKLDFDFILKTNAQKVYTVIPETVGQFTGLTDKNGKKIFEGDIVKYTRKNMYAPETSFHKQDIVSIHKIYWDNSNFRFSQEHYDLESKRCIGGGNITFTDWRAKEEEIEVIGNIHEHKGFLEVGDGE